MQSFTGPLASQPPDGPRSTLTLESQPRPAATKRLASRDSSGASTGAAPRSGRGSQAAGSLIRPQR